jgi:hypothetical protein
MMKKGYFITLEGPDGCGKTTQLEFLADYIRSTGREVLTTREPGGVAAAEKIRQLLLDPKIKLAPRAETLLYLAARAEHIYEKIRPALEARQGGYLRPLYGFHPGVPGLCAGAGHGYAPPAEHAGHGRAGPGFDAAY